MCALEFSQSIYMNANAFIVESKIEFIKIKSVDGYGNWKNMQRD